MIKNIDDITEDKKKRDKEIFKEEIVNDVNDIISRILKKRNSQNKDNQKMGWFEILFKIFLAFVIVDALLGSIWVFLFFFKSLFLGG